MAVDKDSLLVTQETYLESGIHIGTKIKTSDMGSFIFKKRDDGLYILDLRQTNARLSKAARLISNYDPSQVLVVASRTYSSNPAKKFSMLTKIPILSGRFVPGTMTNLSYKQFQEPKLILVCDPKGEKEAIMEASKTGVPIIALADTDNELKYVDLAVPCNNKGKRSLALIFYILSREITMSQGLIKSYDEFKSTISDFEQSIDDSHEKKKTDNTQPASAGPEAKNEEPETA